MTRRRLDLNPQDYAIHYRTRRWSATLIIAKTLRWFSARVRRSARRSRAVSAFRLRRTRRARLTLPWMVGSIRRAQGAFRPAGVTFRPDSHGRYYPSYLALFLIALLGASAPASGTASQRREHRESESSTAQPVPPKRAPSWGFELFGRGGFAGVAADGAAVWAGTVFRIPDPFPAELHWEASQHGRNPVWGAGFRALRGHWGFETQYVRTTGLFRLPGVFREAPFEPLRALAAGEEPEHLLIAQGIFQAPIAAGRAQLSIGLGAGLARVPTLDTSRRDGVLLSDFVAIDHSISPPGEAGLQQSLSNRLTLREERDPRHSLLLGGSAGITLRSGRLLVRPRIDLFLGPTYETSASWSVAGEFDLPDVGRHRVDLGTESVEVSVRPLFVLFSVDLGWSSRR